MTALAHLAMFGWIPLILLIFAFAPPRRAILVAYIGGFLFLPNAAYELSGMPDYTKTTAAGLAVLLGVVIFDSRTVLSFRLRWFDLPMVVFCSSVVVTSIVNDLGVYDGLSRLLERLVDWGLPYLVGRTYFSNRQGMYELAMGLFIGGLIYVPLCLWEIRMSPNLHNQLYGFRARNFGLGIRYGGYRPIVFLWSYIPVANWLAGAAVAGFWLWWSDRQGRFLGFPMIVPVLALLATMLLAKTLAAVVLLVLGFGVLLSRGALRPNLLRVLVLVVPLIVGFRATAVWDGEGLVNLAGMVSEERADSLRYRIDNENKLAEKALQRPLFGWGGWGRARVYDDRGKDVSTTDGLWIIVLGKSGWVGLGSLLAMFVVTLLRFDRRFPGRSWLRRDIAPAAVAATIVLMGFINNIPNVTNNPLIPIAIGGVGSFTLAVPAHRGGSRPGAVTGVGDSSRRPRPAKRAYRPRVSDPRPTRS